MITLGFLLQVNIQSAVTDTLSRATPKESSMSLWDLAMKGGWIMLPIGLLLITTVYIFFERFFYIKMAAKTDAEFMSKIRDYIHQAKIDTALNLCQSTNMPVARMIEKGIKRIGRPLKEIEVIKIFYNISLADNISIGNIAGGLYEKMITSAAGLLVGIIAFIAYHWLNVMIEKVVHTLELNVMNFIDLLQEPTK